MDATGVVSACRQCVAEQMHCHGTLVQHWGQPAHCTEPDCDFPEAILHSLAIDCDAIGCPCDEGAAHRSLPDELAV